MATRADVTCDQWRDLISASVDGELDDADQARLDRHLDGCAACRHYHEDAWSLRRVLRVGLAPTGDTTAIDAVGSTQPGGPGMLDLLRWALFVAGGTLIIVNGPVLAGAAGGSDSHLTRHDAIFGIALGIAMLVVVARPYRAIGLVPVTSAVAGLMIVTAVVDIVRGRASILGESVHAVELVGLLCLWVISGGPTRLRRHLRSLATSAG